MELETDNLAESLDALKATWGRFANSPCERWLFSAAPFILSPEKRLYSTEIPTLLAGWDWGKKTGTDRTSLEDVFVSLWSKWMRKFLR